MSFVRYVDMPLEAKLRGRCVRVQAACKKQCMRHSVSLFMLGASISAKEKTTAFAMVLC